MCVSKQIYPYVPSKQLLVFKIADRLPLSLSPPTYTHTHMCCLGIIYVKFKVFQALFEYPSEKCNENNNINFALYFIRHSPPPAVSQI